MVDARTRASIRSDNVRPLGVVPFGPVFAIVAVLVLAALTGIFALWLAFVGFLVSAIVLSDLAHRSLRRFAKPPLAVLNRHAIG